MSSAEPLSRSRPKRSSAAETEKKMQESLSVEAAPPIKESDLILPEKKKPKTPAKAEAAAEETAEAEPKADGTAAFGKLILFGEHFVVYKVPALVAAVAASTTCEFSYTDEPGLEVIDDRPAVEGYKVEKKAEADEAIAIVLRHFELDPSIKGMRIKFGGDLTAVSGIGASAAQVVALARAISGTRETPLTEEEVNAAGYEGEKGYHGTPSGIDNTAATYGGVLRFQRTEGEPIFTMKKITSPVRIVYASTGITASTSKVVGDVRAKKEADPAWFDALITKYTALVEKGEAALDACDWDTLGGLLNENHALCQELTVSCKELDDLVDAARKAGALGAKMSGTGRGGLMLALTPTEEQQQAVMEALKACGAPQVWSTTLA